jgi:hypothetical protein
MCLKTYRTKTVEYQKMWIKKKYCYSSVYTPSRFIHFFALSVFLSMLGRPLSECCSAPLKPNLEFQLWAGSADFSGQIPFWWGVNSWRALCHRSTARAMSEEHSVGDVS